MASSCRSTTPGSVQSPRCCGPSAGARRSHACSELLVAPKVSPPPGAHREQGVLARASSRAMCCPAPAHGPSPTGTCLRLYSEAFYEQRLPPSPAPHVSETSLSRLVLLLKRLDIADMGQCDFLDRPGGAERVRDGGGGESWGQLRSMLPLERGGSIRRSRAATGLPALGGTISCLTSCPSPRVADAGAGGPGLPGCPG